MRRLDWQLVRPNRGGDVREPLRMVEMLRRLVGREARGDLDAEDSDLLFQLEETYEHDTVSACESVGAPIVEDDPDWEPRIVDEFGASDVDLELEDYLELRRAEPDCERCPYASPYSLFPMDPCEFSAGALEALLQERDLARRAQTAMEPEAMKAYADDLEAALAAGAVRAVEAIDTRDYLEKAIFFLRFWADHGFGVAPTDIDEIVDFPEDDPQSSSDTDDAGPTTYH